jgi:hypothetical protein
VNNQLDTAKPRVFISYSFDDLDFIETVLAPLLHENGIEYWYAQGELRSAQRWEREILRELRAANWFILVMSKNSVDSEWVRNEVNWAMKHRDGNVIPLRLTDCIHEDFHLGIPRIEYVDYTSNRERANRKLLATFGFKSKNNYKSEPPLEFDREQIASNTIREPKIAFHCGHWVPPSYFVGRVHELYRAHQLIAAKQNFLVSGTPRSGKTSFLRRVIHELSTEKSNRKLCSYVNLEQGVQLNLRAFMEHTLLCVFGEMARNVFGCRYSDLLQTESFPVNNNLQDDPDFDRFQRLFRVVSNYTHKEHNQRIQNFLVHDFVSFVNELLEISKRKGFESFVMFYDEANRLPSDISFELLGNLGECLNQTGLIGAYVVGPKTGNQLLALPGLAGNEISIGPFKSDDDMRCLLRLYYFGSDEVSAQLPITNEADTKIWEVSQGKPYLIQLIASAAFGQATRDKSTYLDEKHVDAAYEIIRNERPEAFK